MSYHIQPGTVAICRDCEAQVSEPLYVDIGEFESRQEALCPNCRSGRLWFLKPREKEENWSDD